MLVADEERGPLGEALGQALASVAVELLHPHQDQLDVPLAAEGGDRLGDRAEVVVVEEVRLLGAVVEVDRPVVLLAMLPGEGVSGGLDQVGV